MVMLDC